MPDRVKEAVFAILGNHFDCPGALPGIRVADVFAGSGSMGLEALSRGAASCRFFERDMDALDALRGNIDKLGAGDLTTIANGDAWQKAILSEDGTPFDLVFLDPPYRDSTDTSPAGLVLTYLCKLAEREDNCPLVMLHHAASVSFDLQVATSWQVMDGRRFGSNRVTFFTR